MLRIEKIDSFYTQTHTKVLFENMPYSLKLNLIIETFESDLKSAILIYHTACSGNVSRRFGMAYRYQFIEYRIHIGPNFKGQEYKKVDS